MGPAERREIYVCVGQKIRNLRVIAGDSQTELGAALGVTFQQVQKYEKGANQIAIDKLLVLTRRYNVSLQYFFDQAAVETPHQTHTLDGRECTRLRLEVGRALTHVTAPQFLRAILALIRGVTEEVSAGRHAA